MRVLISALLASAFVVGAAEARPKPATAANPGSPAPTAQAAPPAAPKTPAAKSAAKPRTQISLDCSKQADAKGLHGKERKSFRRSCMKPAKT